MLKTHIIGNKSDIYGVPLPDNLSKFVDKIPIELSFVLDKISEHGGVWIVGGAVRDAAIGVFPDDIDLATDLLPEKILNIFPNSIETGVAFGTVTVKSGKYLFQITTLRTDGKYLDNRRPESVIWNNSLKNDLERRDFTINSMAIDVARRLFYDPHNGLNDIENGIIRCVGNATKRISEDGLRILRAYRFLGHRGNNLWKMDKSLQNAININSFMLENLAKERIWQEFKKILNSKLSNEILIEMLQNGVLENILSNKITSQLQLIKALKSAEKLDYISLFCLINHNLEKYKIIEICKKLKMSNAELKNISERFQYIGYTPEDSISELRLFRFILSEKWQQQLLLEINLRSNSLIEFDAKFDANYINEIFQQISKLKPLTHEKQLVDGNWIMNSTNIEQGKRLGRLKEWLFKLQVQNDLTSMAEIELLLCKINWNEKDFSNWPKLSIL